MHCSCCCFRQRIRSRSQVAEKALRTALIEDKPDLVLNLLETTELSIILQGIEGGNFTSNKALRSLLGFAVEQRELEFIAVAYSCSTKPPDMTLSLTQEAHFIPSIKYALTNQHAGALRALLQLRGDPNLMGEDGMSHAVRALRSESSSKSLALLRPLLEAMANPNLPDYSGLTPFTFAVREGQLNIVRKMLSYPKKRICELAEVLFELDPQTFPRNIGQLVASMVSPEQPILTADVIASSHGVVKKLLTKFEERGSAAPWSQQHEGTAASLFHDPLFCNCPEDTSFCKLVRSGYFDNL